MKVNHYNIKTQANKVIIEVGFDKIDNEQDAKFIAKQVVTNIHIKNL